jgi:hypothetical protein
MDHVLNFILLEQTIKTTKTMKLRLFGRKGHKIYELENKHCSKVTKLCRKFRANGFGTSVMGDDYILVFNQDYPASVLMLIR